MSAGNRIRVLVCDDDADVREMLGLMLRLDDAIEIVGEAQDGADVVRKAEQLQPSVIVLDLMMPRVSGWMALPMIHVVAPRCRVLVLSAVGERERAEEIGDLDGATYLQKGASADVLVGTVRKLAETA